MEHYICTGGCMGVSDKPKVCEDKNCPNFGGPLESCYCEDGKHEERQHRKATPSPEEFKS